jgi:hypothetical protein
MREELIVLKRSQFDSIKKEAEKYKEAVIGANSAQLALWEARVDVMIASGQVESITEIIDLVAWNNNNCQCAAPFDVEQNVIRQR